MEALIQLIYASTARLPFDREALQALLRQSRERNARCGVTGMLLHEDGNFLQVLEGPEHAVLETFARISRDPRHHHAVRIIQEPVAQRSFSDWSMAFADPGREALARLEGFNDFFAGQEMFRQLGASRAKKLVTAFSQGRWRARLAEDADLLASLPLRTLAPAAQAVEPAWSPLTQAIEYSHAFQPIVDVAAQRIASYEALIRGRTGESAWQVLNRVAPQDAYRFDLESRVAAVGLAARLGIACDLNLNLLPGSLLPGPRALAGTVAAARAAGLPVSSLVIELTEGEVVDNRARLVQELDLVRHQGVKIAIDDFGAGYSGLNLLADFQPEQVKIDMALVAGIESHGPRQAIVRGILAVCRDLGIDVIAEGVETRAQYRWLRDEGVSLFQGYLFARPGFECLPGADFPAN